MPSWVISSPDPTKLALYENTNRNSLPFLRAAKIKEGSDKHKQLMRTIQALHHQYLHPCKYIEDQAPDRVDQLIAEAQLSLPWLNKYEQAWPARVYLKRYVAGRRPHLMCTTSSHRGQTRLQKSQASHKPSRKLENSNGTLKDHDSTVKDFLSSLMPSLEHHLDAFVELGVKDQKTLQAFLSWPQAIQEQFLDEGNKVLKLTSLEKRGLLVGCSLMAQKTLQEFLVYT